MPITLPALPFHASALEPHISKSTIDVHYGQHHAAYVARSNQLVADTKLADLDLYALVHAAHASENSALFNSAAQAWNHSFYWNSLRPGGGGQPHGAIATLIDADFGGYDRFVEQLQSAAMGQFGSGWAWVVLNGAHLEIVATSNADNPLVHQQVPLLAIDVWEHAYYLDYQQRRNNYVAGVIEHLLNWDFANENLDADSHSEDASPVVHRAASIYLSAFSLD